jgi:tetratricopeptide (TPR) repeat protein
LLKQRGRLEEAGRALETAIRLNLQNAEAQYNLGVLLQERGRFEEAEQAFQEAIRLNPQDASASKGAAGWLREPWGLEKLSSLSQKADTNLRTPISRRDIFN